MGVELMYLHSALTPLLCYPRPRLTSCRGRLTTFTCGASVRSSAGAPPRMMSKASLGARSRLKSGATVSSLIIRSRFTTHSKRIQAGDVSKAHTLRTNLANTKTLVTFQTLISSHGQRFWQTNSDYRRRKRRGGPARDDFAQSGLQSLDSGRRRKRFAEGAGQPARFHHS